MLFRSLIGNGRAAALLFAREGAKVLIVDRDLKRAEETVQLIAKEGGSAQACAGDWTSTADCAAYVKACNELVPRWRELATRCRSSIAASSNWYASLA